MCQKMKKLERLTMNDTKPSHQDVFPAPLSFIKTLMITFSEFCPFAQPIFLKTLILIWNLRERFFFKFENTMLITSESRLRTILAG